MTTRLIPDSPELRRVNWLLQHVIGPTECWRRRWLNYLLVVPECYLALFSSVEYQLYLNAIFHTHWVTQTLHYLCTHTIMALMFRLTLESQTWLVPLILFSLSGWYLVVTLSKNWGLWTILAQLDLAALYLIAFVTYINQTNMTGLSTLSLVMLAVGIQGVSHSWEPRAPPYISRQSGWVDRTSCGLTGPTFMVWLVASQGCILEFIAVPKLVPLQLLELMFACGYKPEAAGQIKLSAKQALMSGNPAVHYVGIGG
jgi:hypothetical protein